ncbi:MAG TPA: glycosyltransferase family 4 protein [Dokdonella sp.]|uniref:glycosyltransferase family 4 protein n=1 Tax=Dokdonella sp. TaxID=2291710 RepID=UPI002D7E69E6|nr:glycosyltransferase family 4 protein [Dokdonella sp.]HET9032956.1 glycosyltransferase family 4 protein [Dokdonella sp.]
MSSRIAIVVPRCHERLVGGAEALAWQYAQLLSSAYKVEILTSTAFDYMRWDNDLKAGVEERDGITIRRFHVARGRTAYFHALHRNMLDAFKRSEANAPDRRYCWPEALEEEFIRAQGPNCPDLSTWLAIHEDDYAAIFFLPYLYPTTLDGSRALSHRRWALIPALHDEPPAYLKTFGRMARTAPRVLWNAEAERRLGARIWNLDSGHVVSMTVATDLVSAAMEARPYLLYCGRIDVSKGCAQLLEGFEAYKAAHPESDLQLVLTGNDVLGVGKRKDVRYLGFVEEQRKFELMAGAVAFVQPSPYESLSIVLLEAMAQRTPVIVNGRCEVLVDHVKSSASGLIYADQNEFIGSIGKMLAMSGKRRALEGDNARNYVLKNYSREQITTRLMAEVETLAAG